MEDDWKMEEEVERKEKDEVRSTRRMEDEVEVENGRSSEDGMEVMTELEDDRKLIEQRDSAGNGKEEVRKINPAGSRPLVQSKIASGYRVNFKVQPSTPQGIKVKRARKPPKPKVTSKKANTILRYFQRKEVLSEDEDERRQGANPSPGK